MLKRGRPKGAGLTFIGLPKRRKVSGAVPFVKKSPTEKEKGMDNLKLIIFLTYSMYRVSQEKVIQLQQAVVHTFIGIQA